MRKTVKLLQLAINTAEFILAPGHPKIVPVGNQVADKG